MYSLIFLKISSKALRTLYCHFSFVETRGSVPTYTCSSFCMPTHLSYTLILVKGAARQVGKWIITGQSVNSTGKKFYMHFVY